MIRFWPNAALVSCLTFGVAVSAHAADVEKGKAIFERCAACHSLEAGKNEDAPSLRGVFGRKIASVEEYRYSAAMKRSDVVWTQSTLNTFIEDPQAFIPGNRMPFDGLKDKSEREDLLAYLELATKTAAAAVRSVLQTVAAVYLGGCALSLEVSRYRACASRALALRGQVLQR